MPARPIAIDDAEAIFEPFWDPDLSPLARWAVAPAPASNARVAQFWCWVTTEWDRAQPGVPVLTMQRNMSVPLAGYDTLILSCGQPLTVRLTVHICVDGQWQTAIAAARGANEGVELSAPLQGRMIEAIHLELTPDTAEPGAGWLCWFGLANSQRLAGLLQRESSPPYTADWPGLAAPVDAQTVAPQLGLLFGGEDLAAIRRRATRRGYAEVMAGLRAAARAAKQQEPEKRIRQFLPTGSGGRYARPRDRQPDMYTPAIVCAFVGLIDQDPAMLHMAARFALSMSHLEHWCEGVIERFPGSRWTQRSFRECMATGACALVLDWAGQTLTPQGRMVIRHAIAAKGLPRIHQDFLEQEYIHHCNQAVIFSRGRILGLLALAHDWPRSEDYLHIALQDLQRALEATVLDDGGYGEPAGYFFVNGYWGMPPLVAMARHMGRTVEELLPPQLQRSIDFITTVSSAAQPGTILPFGDSSGTLDVDGVALFGRFLHDPRWTRLLHNRLALMSAESQAPGKPPAAISDAGVLALALGPDDDPPDGDLVPTFCILPNTSQLVSCRPGPGGLIRLQLIGAPQSCGHSHEDKGSFILEAYGDILAIDQGICNYGQARTNLMKYATNHNLLTPVMADGSLSRQVNPAPKAICPSGWGTDIAMQAEIDVTELWHGLFTRCVRRVVSERPEVFAIEDEAELVQPGAVAFHLHSRFPIRQDGAAFVMEGDHARLMIAPDWAPASFLCRLDGLDGDDRPVWHLEIISKPAAVHNLKTWLRVERMNT